MFYVVGQPVAHIFELMKDFLNNMGTTNAVLMGIILASMMCIDLGGPINKAAYALQSDYLPPIPICQWQPRWQAVWFLQLGWQLQLSSLEINLVLVKRCR